MDQPDVKRIQDAVRKRYADLDGSTAGPFAYLTGRAGALTLGYEPTLLDAVSDHEIYRVLRRDGRLQFADIVLKGDLAPEVASNLDAWSD